jgi:hypothetical protein
MKLCCTPLTEEKFVATAMLMHRRLGGSCALSHLDDITKDALLRLVVGHVQKTKLTVFYREESDDEELCDSVELESENPHQLQSAVKFEDDDITPCFYIVRDEENKTVVELKYCR